jgi:TRAP-type C4-dicarboxylate transport system substrate-binding protein
MTVFRKFTAAACLAAALATQAFAAEVEWKVGSTVGPADPGTQMLEEFARRVGEKSNGEIKIEVVPLESIGFKPADSLRVLKQGVLDAMALAPYYLDRDEPMLSVFMPHGGLMDPEDNLKILDVQHEIAQQIYDKWDVVTVGKTFQGELREQTLVSRVPVDSLEDLRKIKLRHFTKLGIDSFNALGVSTQTMPSSELYLALKTGVVDASLYAPVYTKSQSIYEVACCSSMIGVFATSTPTAIGASRQAWSKLSDEQKQIMQDALAEMFDESVEVWREAKPQKEAVDFLKQQEGFEILEPFSEEDRREIQRAVLDEWRKFAESLGPEGIDAYERIIAALN